MPIKKLIVILLIFLASGKLSAQLLIRADDKSPSTVPMPRTSEFGGFIGGSYYIGELNPKASFMPPNIKPSFGLFMRRNLNSRLAWRLSGNVGKLYGTDADGEFIIDKQRNASFTSTVMEGSMLGEFNFFYFNPTNEKIYFCPYLFAGFGMFWFSPKSETGNVDLRAQENESESYSKIQPSLPFGMGVKLKLHHRLIFGLEWGMRKTFTDYLDDVSTSYRLTGYQRGNSSTKDFYSLIGLNVSFRFGEKPSSCASFEKLY